LKTGLHLQVRAHVSRLGQIHQTLVDIDTGAQISCVSEQWATDQQFPQNSECSSTIIKATGYSFPARMAYYCNTTPPTVFNAAGSNITRSPKRVSGVRGQAKLQLRSRPSEELSKSFHGPEPVTTARSRPADHHCRPERRSVSFAMGQDNRSLAKR
jgi:hypothetical protein